jgi:DNA polymerase-3 subunit beta
MPVSYAGAAFNVMLNPQFLNDFLRVLNPERVVTMEVRGSDAAVVFSTDDNYTYLVMPLAREGS